MELPQKFMKSFRKSHGKLVVVLRVEKSYVVAILQLVNGVKIIPFLAWSTKFKAMMRLMRTVQKCKNHVLSLSNHVKLKLLVCSSLPFGSKQGMYKFVGVMKA